MIAKCRAFWLLALFQVLFQGTTICGVAKSDDVKLTQVAKPSGLPDAWKHPDDTSLLDGKCGLTAVSNLLRLYKIEVDPASIDESRFRSWGPGLRRDKFAEDMNELAKELEFESRNLEDDTDALSRLERYIAEGKPVAIMYMTNKEAPSVEAHWIVVVAIRRTSDQPRNPKLVVQSWGKYHEVEWNEISGAWKRGYGGSYPHVVGKAASPYLSKP